MTKFNKILVFTLVALFSFSNNWAQIPDGYYNNAEGKTNDELKTALYQIIKGHVEFPYTSYDTDTWDILKKADQDPDSTDNVLLIYSGISTNGEQEYNNATGWTREHVWAKSRGDFGTDTGVGTDTHNLRACHNTFNSKRNNRWFAYATEMYVYDGRDTWNKFSDENWTWEPRQSVKGDVARCIFYMATRYEGENGELDLEVINYLPSDNYTKEPVHAALSVLYKWHLLDPVDDFERNRNNVIYLYQENRNPFIDRPEFVEQIWGETVSATTKTLVETIAYPNPSANGRLNLRFANTAQRQVKIGNMSGKIIQTLETSVKETTLQLPRGLFLLTIQSAEGTENIKVVIN